ncbi:MAG: 2Fe-2S iron-sulfur cluster-binding protein [Granulosicoccus sp.]
MRLFSTKNRPSHLGPYPLERLKRTSTKPILNNAPKFEQQSFNRDNTPESIVNAMREYQALLDTIRIGLTNKCVADCPGSPNERTNHLKAYGYFCDASMVGIAKLPDSARLANPFRNPDVDRLAEDLKNRQTKTLASGIDLIMADLRDSMMSPHTTVDDHSHAIVFLYEYPRDPSPDEPGVDWLDNAQAARASLRANETAVVIANYLRLLGFEARSHSASTSDVDLHQLTVAAGLTTVEQGKLCNPYIADRFGVSAVTTTFQITPDQPLVAQAEQPFSLKGIAWQLGKGTLKNAYNHIPFAKRRFVDGAHPFEKLKRVDLPTTYIDEKRVARVPKRTDMFARSLFGDMGKINQEAAKGGKYVNKAAPSTAQRRVLGACVLLQDGEPADNISETARDAERNAQNIKATAYFLGVDAVGLSRCPDWSWYSHDAAGVVIEPPHDQAISMIIDQGYETMEGASGDDWIAVSQSMRAYLRFSVLGGVIAKQIRNLGYPAKAHSVMDGEVLQPPLLLLSGLGEVSRIGEVILNPYLGPRLKSGVVTTTMPMTHDKPINFGLQDFCENCNKCARECPAGAITAGPKLMFNGYEIWKSDSQKCTTYRLTTPGGAMCGRCMKTCPWNLEGLFAEAPFRWAAMKIPRAAPLLARLDDAVGNGERNPVKKWWWDLERQPDGRYKPTTHTVNIRNLQKGLKLKFEDQTLAVYPANLAPPPWPFPFPMDREKGIEAYQAMVSAKHYKEQITSGDATALIHEYKIAGNNPVLKVVLSKVQKMTSKISKYEFQSVDGSPLPHWQAGAHIDVVVAPEYVRQYSMSGNPEIRSTYQIAVLREDQGKGGSALLHRIFLEGRILFLSKPINHFPLATDAARHILMGGGIGITPMIAMAHELHAQGKTFEMHYSCSARSEAGFLDDIASVPWKHSVYFYFSDENGRADLNTVIPQYKPGYHLYTCGPDGYMQNVLKTATLKGYEEDSLHQEYFSAPEAPEYVNNEFTIRLSRSNISVPVKANQAPTDALAEHGVHVDVKCSDGLCGVCKCTVLSGNVEHRDYVLSNKQRQNSMILCQSRAVQKGGTLEIDL